MFSVKYLALSKLKHPMTTMRIITLLFYYNENCGLWVDAAAFLIIFVHIRVSVFSPVGWSPGTLELCLFLLETEPYETHIKYYSENRSDPWPMHSSNTTGYRKTEALNAKQMH